MSTLSSEINPVTCLHPLDYAIFVFLLLCTFFLVLWGQKAKSSFQKTNPFLDYMLMGRQLTLPMFTMTLVATWYGGIFGVTEIAFESGLFNFLTQGIFWYLTYLIFAFFLVDKISKYESLTLPELIGQLFGPKAKVVAAIFNFFNVVPITYTISLGLLIGTFTGLGLFESCLIGVLFACFYSSFGGFRAIVFSDLLQFFIMCSSVALVLVFSLYKFGFLILFERLPDTHFSFTGKQSLMTTFAWGFIALSTLVDPNFYQRCFAAKSPKIAKKGIIFATFIWCLFDLCTTFGAMYAAALIPTAKPQTAYLIYSLQILPLGFKGFFLSGIAATVLSTIDSYLFIASNTLSYDLAPKFLKKNLFFGKISLLFTGLLSTLLAVAFSGSIKTVWKTLGSYSAGCLLAPVALHLLFNIKVTEKIFLSATLLSALGITVCHVVKLEIIDDLYVGVFISCLCLFLGNLREEFF